MNPVFAHPIRALAFDLDGTLVHSLPDLMAAAQALRQSQNLAPLPEAELCRFIGDGMGVYVHRVLTGQYDGLAEQNKWEQGFAFFVRHYRDHLCVGSHLYHGVNEGLALFKTLGLPLAVITNKNEILAVELLRTLDIAHYFSLIIGGDTLSERKPSPLPLQHTASVLGVSVHEMPLIGDSANDILAAKASGSPSILVNYGYGDPQTLQSDQHTRADLLIGSLTELYDFLRQAPQS